MAVATIVTDTWLQHLLFTGGRRQTDFGPIDGLFYGVIAVDGDATGGNVTLNGNVSFDRKEDWIYILKKVSGSVNVDIGGNSTFFVAATGPLIPTPTAVANPSFHVGGIAEPIPNNSVTIATPSDSGESPLADLPVFGDKRIAGPLSLLAQGWEINTNGATYQMSVYGHLIEYGSFFRNLASSRLG